MALITADRVKETTTVTGTGAATLLGAAVGFQTFSSAIGNGNTCYYVIAGQGTSEWEVGIGTYASAGNTLTRTTILSSSNANAAVNFSAGTKDIFVTYTASRSVYLDSSGNASALGTVSSGVWNGTAVGVAYGGTGQTTLAANAVLVGNGTSGVSTVAPGSSGNVLTSNGTSWASSTPAANPYVGNKGQVFTGNGTFTIPTGVTAVKVTVVGGGGGGAAGNASGSNGGGGGGTAIKYLTGLTPGNTLAVTVGGGGGGGSAPSGGGSAGGSSTVASGTQTITTITGGGGSQGGSGNGNGGSGTNGDLNISGRRALGNTAGNSFMGMGGILYGAGTGPSGSAYGGGGAQGSGDPKGSGFSGGSGAAGVVIFEW